MELGAWSLELGAELVQLELELELELGGVEVFLVEGLAPGVVSGAEMSPSGPRKT